MSYIRPLSNPEGLYIWDDVRGGTVISHCVRPPHASPEEHTTIGIPRRVFREVCRRWGRSYDTDVRYGACRVREVHVFVRSGKPVPRRRTMMQVLRGPKTTYAIEFRYKRQWFRMWRVTWSYVVDSVAARGARRKAARQVAATEGKTQ